MGEINLQELRRQLPYKWRVQSFSQYKPEATCVAYIDSRDVQNLLDEVVGPENWQDEYHEVKGNLFCRIGIYLGGQWVWKGDCGTESNTEAEKGEASDAFKRAAVKWGVGRFLYGLGLVKVGASETLSQDKRNARNVFVVDERGQRIWDLTEYINGLQPRQRSARPAQQPQRAAQPAQRGDSAPQPVHDTSHYPPDDAPMCPVHTNLTMRPAKSGKGWYCTGKTNGVWCKETA